MSKASDERDERPKSFVDLDGANKAVHLGRSRTHEIDLTNHTLARAYAPGLPFVLDGAPSRIGKSFKKQIRCIDRSDRSIEIYEHTALHTRS